MYMSLTRKEEREFDKEEKQRDKERWKASKTLAIKMFGKQAVKEAIKESRRGHCESVT